MSWSTALTRLNRKVRDTFGSPVTWRVTGANPVDITAVLSEPATKGEAVPPNYRTAWIVQSDAPTIARGDILSTLDGTYRVVDVDPDGGNGFNITLEKVAAGWLPSDTNIQPSVIIGTGPVADRPAIAREGDMYIADDEDKIYVWFE
jgi:hypothetical protein